MKSYTDLEQSKKLVEILPIKSADMYIDTTVTPSFTGLIREDVPRPVTINDLTGNKGLYPCWSLTALFSVLPSATLDSSGDHYYRLHCMERFTEWYDNPIDACYEMIIRLNELKL